MMFRDRADGGQRLAARLSSLAAERPIVLALPRGGVPVAAEVARALGAPLEILVARKIGAPQDPEVAVGAVAEEGATYIDSARCLAMHVTPGRLHQLALHERQAVDDAVTRWRGGRPLPELGGRTVIVVDDGLATGATMRAALRALERHRPRSIVVAVPVAAADVAEELRQEVAQVVAVREPLGFGAVSPYYRTFDEVSDDEVRAILAEHRGPLPLDGRVEIPITGETAIGGETLVGELTRPERPIGVVVLLHGSGSVRTMPRDLVVERLRAGGFATLRLDLLSEREQAIDAPLGELRFDVARLAARLVGVGQWLRAQAELAGLAIGYLGDGLGAATALVAAASAGAGAAAGVAAADVAAVVTRGGRVDLAGAALAQLRTPTLLVVGSADDEVLDFNERAITAMSCDKELVLVDGASHPFGEPGALELFAQLATRWFARHLQAAPVAALA